MSAVAPTRRPPTHDTPRTLRDEIGVLRRRKWIILAFLALVPLAAVGFSLREPARYRATSEVLLAGQNLPPSLSGSQAANDAQLASRNVETSVQLAQVQPIAVNVIRALSINDLTPSQLQTHLSVSSAANTDLLTFSVTDRSHDRVIRLATEYARQFVLYRSQLNTVALRSALGEVQKQLRALRAHHRGVQSLRASLTGQAQQLKTYEALQTSSAAVVQQATGATQVQPRTSRNVLIGVALGVALGVIAAFVREALDTRVRSEEEVSQRLDVPLLGRIPEPARGRRRGAKLAMLEEPNALEAEAFRVLRTNVYFALLSAKVNTIMVASASQGEGKSTTAANLAVALARDNVPVTFVDLDLRSPGAHRFFGLSQEPGVTDVALHRVDLDTGLNRIDIGRGSSRDGSENGRAGLDGRFQDGELNVLCAGTTPPDPGDFIGTSALTEVLDRVANKSDIVLIDAPPLIGVGDAIRLTASVDAVIAVVNVNLLRRDVLNELRRVFASSPARVLGFVAIGTSPSPAYGKTYVQAAGENAGVEDGLPAIRPRA